MRSAGSTLILCVICALTSHLASARKSTRRVRSGKRLNATAAVGAAATAAAATTTLRSWTTARGQKCEMRRICKGGDTDLTLPTDKDKPKDFVEKNAEKSDGNSSDTVGGGAHFDLGKKGAHITIPGELDACYTIVFPPSCPETPAEAGPTGCAALKDKKACVMAPIAPHGCNWFDELAATHDGDSRRQNYLGERALQAAGVSATQFIEVDEEPEKKEEGGEKKGNDPHNVNGVEVDNPSEGQALDQEWVKEAKFGAHKEYCTANIGVKEDYTGLIAGLGVPAVEAHIESLRAAYRDNAG